MRGKRVGKGKGERGGKGQTKRGVDRRGRSRCCNSHKTGKSSTKKGQNRSERKGKEKKRMSAQQPNTSSALGRLSNRNVVEQELSYNGIIVIRSLNVHNRELIIFFSLLDIFSFYSSSFFIS